MFEKSKKVSVIVPCYNTELYIRETINSILSQTYRDIELIVINDGSTDSSGRILEEYRDEIMVIKQENKGVAVSRNAGITRSSGGFISFCDSDDVWMPSKLEQQIEVFERYPNVGVVSSETMKIDNESRVISKEKRLRNSCYDRPIDLRTQLLMEGNIISLPSSVVRREIIQQLRGFDTKHGILSKDYDLWLRASELTKFYIISEHFASYRVLQHSMIHGSLRKEYKPQFQWLYVHREKYSKDQYRIRRSKIYRDWAVDSFHKNEQMAWKLLRKSIALDPANCELGMVMIKEAVKYSVRKIMRIIRNLKDRDKW